ncbi:helix-turn-helix domain-containing protein [Mycobacterium intracellulare]|uniref:Helix-turn-helix domain-containing protein n=1 Tax=Mycobacterium intracellulare TaxID=1767 RepID=A0AAE4UF59_MYCIT|nr:helix-turn-helix domain-containing protein [Mycobacterium intracellulare]MDV6979303.1 helix-turn-helix domain-containing protein [Mycobacterium intracellulare]MDV6984730.1 helix-turn-helix domain-containing protein [Mycobacterium intracellulare]MDV7014834.1 helix-turn-helix domain-containing protein [Mycobacterium intracellulare]MDV7030716.1 helix-turn-helix domain-containing protein [Mycobacterium intracellulare]
MTASQQMGIPTLTARVGRVEHILDPAAGVAFVGRDASAAVGVDDERVSRRHVRLEPHPGGWRAVDTSTNGMFVEGIPRSAVPVTAAVTLHLGAPDGVAVTLAPADAHDESTQALRPAQTEFPSWDSQKDPGVVRAGRAVAERRLELGISQREIDRRKILNASTLIKFEKGDSWPRPKTLEKLEEALQWPIGYITALRRGAAVGPPVHEPGNDDATEVLTDTIQAPMMARTVELAMQTLSKAIADLPEPTASDFTPKAIAILADLRKLEGLASNAARHATGGPDALKALSSVRRSYNDVMMRAAGSPTATLGQRLYGARHRAELSLEEAASGAGLPAPVLYDAEAERPLASEAAEAIEGLIAELTIT